MVNVHVDDPANQSAAEEAAQNVATALFAWQDRLESAGPNQAVSILGFTLSASQVLDIIRSTQWVLTDRTYGEVNGGVGASVVYPDGSRTNYLDFRGFISANASGYAAPGYVNGEGMLFIIMHEIAHLSSIGNAFRRAHEITWSRNNSNPRAQYQDSQYFVNVEKFSNDIARAMMEAFLPFGTGAFGMPRFGYGAVSIGRVGRG